MIRYILKKCKNNKLPIFGKWFAYPVIEETITEEGLAEHMASHNTPFSQGAIKGMLTDMINCIHELLLEGKNVKLTNLAIFSIGIKNAKGGALSEETFSVQKNVQGVKLRARATGIMLAKGLSLVSSLKKALALSGASTATASPTGDDDDPQDTDPTDSQGGTTGSTNNGGSTGGSTGGNTGGSTGGNTGGSDNGGTNGGSGGNGSSTGGDNGGNTGGSGGNDGGGGESGDAE